MVAGGKLVFIGIDGAVPATVWRYAAEGLLPNIGRLIRRGVWFDNCLPAFPTITPTCWATLATGATPATHGVTCQVLHLPGRRLDDPMAAYRSETCSAERWWEAAARVGKRSVIFHYPTSGPARLDHVLQVNGTGCSALEYLPPDARLGKKYYYGVGPRLFSEQSQAGGQWFEGSTPPSGQWQDPKAHTEAAVDVQAGRRIAHLHVETEDSLWGVAPFDWCVEFVGDRVLIKCSPGDEAPQVSLAGGEWSPLLERTLSTNHGPHAFRYRVKALESGTPGRAPRIFFTPLAELGPNVNSPGFAAALQAIPQVPAYDGHHSYFGSGALDDHTFCEIEQMNLDWQAAAIERAWDSHASDIAVAYTVMMDSINHKYRNLIEGLQGDSVSRARAVETERLAYQLVDAFVGRLVEMAGRAALVVLASDHGSVGYTCLFDPRDALKKAGLLVTRTGPDGKSEEVVWEETRAIPFSSVHIYVNLKGRDPQGIVEPEDYERTVRDVLAALHAYRDPQINARGVALALSRNDAALLGLGGDRTGDVVWGVSGRVGGYIGGVHACQIPTAASPSGDIRSLLLMAGPAFRQGGRLPEVAHQWDVAPTLCRAMGWPMPAQAEGRVIRNALA